jgi:hypothetical protein
MMFRFVVFVFSFFKLIELLKSVVSMGNDFDLVRSLKCAELSDTIS